MDSVEVVKGFLHMLNGRKPTPQELEMVSPHLDAICERLRHVHAKGYEAVFISDDVVELMKLAGKQVGTKKSRFAIRRAAGLL